MSKTYLDLSAVGMRFKTDKGFFEALVDVNLKIAKGEFISLIGHSGCGKSTVLNLVAGIDTAGGQVSAPHGGLTDPEPSRVMTGRYIHGTIHRLAIVGRPEGQAWPVTMREVYEDFQRGE